MRKLILVNILVVAQIFAYPQLDQSIHSSNPDYTTPIPIVNQHSSSDPDGGFNITYETGNGIKVQNSGIVKNILIPRHEDVNGKIVEEHGEKILVQEGFYSYTDPDGQIISVTYIADENGFQPIGAHIPTLAPEHFQQLHQERPIQDFRPQGQLSQDISSVPSQLPGQLNQQITSVPSQRRQPSHQSHGLNEQISSIPSQQFHQFDQGRGFQPNFNTNQQFQSLSQGGRVRRETELVQERNIQHGHNQITQERPIYNNVPQERPIERPIHGTQSIPQERPIEQGYPNIPQERPIHGTQSIPQERPIEQYGRRYARQIELNQERLIGTRNLYGIPQERPIQSYQPLNQERPIQPYQPLNQERPIQPYQPLNQERPIQPYQPLNQERPIQSYRPLNQERPIQSYQPLNQERPIQSYQPLNQERPIQPYQPLNQERPIQSYPQHL